MKNRIQLLTKIVCASGIVLLMAGGAQADTIISFSEADVLGATVSAGTLATPALVAAGDVITSQSYTVDGLTLDGDAIDDSVTLTFTFTGANSNGAANISWDPDVDNPGANEYDVNTGTFNAVGESITFGAITLTPGTSSDGSALVLNSAVWDAVSYRRWAANDRSSITGDVTTIASNTSQEASLADTSFTTAYIVGAGGGDSWNIDDYGFTVDVGVVAVPEPSSMALLGLGGMFLASRRRRA